MRLIDRLQSYLQYSHISAYAFEHQCGLSNGYLGKQLKGKGSVGSDILERIREHYTDLSLHWLLTGKGTMLLVPLNGEPERQSLELNEQQQLYFTSKEELISLLKRQISKLETIVSDKDKIIALLEQQVRYLSQPAYKRAH